MISTNFTSVSHLQLMYEEDNILSEFIAVHRAERLTQPTSGAFIFGGLRLEPFFGRE